MSLHSRPGESNAAKDNRTTGRGEREGEADTEGAQAVKVWSRQVHWNVWQLQLCGNKLLRNTQTATAKQPRIVTVTLTECHKKGRGGEEGAREGTQAA